MLTMLESPAAERNKGAILEVLLRYLPGDWSGRILEVAAGTGQHVAHYAKTLTHATFQPTDIDKEYLSSIAAYTRNRKLANVRPPAYVDITTKPETWEGGDFSDSSYDAMINANMIHISPWQTSIGIFHAAGRLLKPEGYLFMYGPFAQDGVLKPQSNVDFNASLRSRDQKWGIRDIKDLKKLAEENNIVLLDMIDMPANNKTLIWQKKS